MFRLFLKSQATRVTSLDSTVFRRSFATALGFLSVFDSYALLASLTVAHQLDSLFQPSCCYFAADAVSFNFLPGALFTHQRTAFLVCIRVLQWLAPPTCELLAFDDAYMSD